VPRSLQNEIDSRVAYEDDQLDAKTRDGRRTRAAILTVSVSSAVAPRPTSRKLRHPSSLSDASISPSGLQATIVPASP
jgi:hypothetical protein